MNRKIKAFGLALVAALAVTVIGASVAQAQFTSDKEHSIFSGTQKEFTNDVFTAGEGFGGIACGNITFGATAASKLESTLALHMIYSNCVDSFGRIVDVDNNGLIYTLTTGANKGVVDVSGGGTLTITSLNQPSNVDCTVIYKVPQSNNGTTYVNRGGSKGIEITRHSTNLVTTTSGGFFNCGVANGEHKIGTYDGIWTVTGKDTSGAAASISVD